jgi:sensor histidine kinase regulating citrate/malate metabolism
LKTEDANLCIRVINPSPPVDIPNSELPDTSKGDRQHHGLGLSTIKRIAQQYGGSVLCTYDNGEFTLYVQMINSAAI